MQGLRIVAPNILIISHGIISSYLLGEEFLFRTTYLFLLLHPVIRHNTLMYFSNCRYRHSHMHVSAVLVYVFKSFEQSKVYEPICHKSLYYCVPTFARIPLGYSRIFLVACSRVLSQLNPNFAKAEIKVMSNIELEIVQIPDAIAPLLFTTPLSWTE